MILRLLLAGLALRTVPVEEPVLDVRVADIDADGREDLIAVTEKSLLLLRAGKGPLIRRPVAPVVVVGRGLLGVVRDGLFRPVRDPFGDFEEGPPGAPSLLGALGKAKPAILVAPGDLDGDGRDDPVLAGPDGLSTPDGLIPVPPRATLEIGRNETFAVRYEIPVPVVGAWTGPDLTEVVLFDKGEILAFRRGREVDRLPLPITSETKDTEGLRRNHVFVRDVDGDGRLDLVVVMAKGRAGLFAAFEATAFHWPGGRVHSRERKRFHRPASTIKVAGALLAPGLFDLDGDGDLDLVLSTINTGILAGATGTAPGTFHAFRFEDGAFQRQPAWTHRGTVPLSSFTEDPQPPVVFLPDLDGDGSPEILVLGEKVRAGEAEAEFASPGRPAIGRTMAALPGEHGILVVEAGE